MKKLSLFFLFSLVFAEYLFTEQLFWDSNAAQDYAERLASHPEFPNLISSTDLGLEGRAKTEYNDLSEKMNLLREKSADMIILAREVQSDIFKMNKWTYFAQQVVLKFFNKGLILKLEKLVDYEHEVGELNSEILSYDFSILMDELEKTESLSVFSGEISTSDKVTFIDLEMRAKDFKIIRGYRPFNVLMSFKEWGCHWNFEGSDFVVPKYVMDQNLFLDITSYCSPDEYYTQEQLEYSIIGPDWSELNTRLNWAVDFSKYISLVYTHVSGLRSEAFLNLDKGVGILNQANTLQNILNDTSVLLALNELSPNKGLLSVERDLKFSEINKSFIDIKNKIHSAELSKNLGEKFILFKDAIKTYNYFETFVSLSWGILEEKIETMEDLCRTYGGECTFQGDLSNKLKQTSKKFLELRAEHLEELGLNEDAWVLRINELKGELEALEKLLIRVEPYTTVSLLTKYADTLKTFQSDLSFMISTNKMFPDQAEKLKWKIIQLSDEIFSDFFKNNRDKALGIKAKLLTIISQLSSHIEFPEIKNLEISAYTPNVLTNIIYYLSLEEYVDELNEIYIDLLSDFSSNVPSTVKCIPEIPIIGKDFVVECVVIVNNTWGISLDKASSLLDLKFRPVNIDSGNFVGDISYLTSVSFSEEKVRLNLKNLPALSFFEFSYNSNLGDASYGCITSSIGLSSEIECKVFTTCDFSQGRVSMSHPFSGKQMEASHPYTYDGSNIFVTVPCNKETRVVFKGPSVEIISSDNGFLVTNLVNSTIDFVNEFSAEELGFDTPAIIGVTLSPFEEKEVIVNTDLTMIFSDDEKSKEIISVPEILGYSDYEEAAKEIFEKVHSEYGCVESNIISEVSKTHKLPKLQCIRLEGVEKNIELFKSENYQQAVEGYFKLFKDSGLEAFLFRSSNYENEAKELLSQAKISVSNIISSKLAGPYVIKAEEAYFKKDYITSMYYSKYAMMKSAINLGFGFRTIIAIAILIFGIYSTRGNNKQEELI